MIFDVANMQSTMLEYQIDLEKMPLGKLSKNHILGAYRVLTELMNMLSLGGDHSVNVLDASNRFYTLIPHNTGREMPSLLNNTDIIKTKIEMLDNLLELEVAYSIIQSESEDHSTADPLDVHYEKLHCKMEALDHSSVEFSLIKKYLENTHGSTHNTFSLEIVDVLKLDREGESARFKRDIGNVHLLWHGSRLSNYVGILSQGLRIAPPEAPVTGYMFGKGIYCADMISKSANYCHAYNTEGFLVLCEVALGEVHERKKAKESICKPPKGKHSVKGIGSIFPDPKQMVTTEDEVRIPCGKPVNSEEKGLELIYNEYIVYDESQVRMKYLVRAKFVYQIAF